MTAFNCCFVEVDSQVSKAHNKQKLIYAVKCFAQRKRFEKPYKRMRCRNINIVPTNITLCYAVVTVKPIWSPVKLTVRTTTNKYKVTVFIPTMNTILKLENQEKLHHHSKAYSLEVSSQR